MRALLTIIGHIDTVRNGESSLPGVPATLTHFLVRELVVWESLIGPTDECCLHPLAHAALGVIGWVEWVVGGVFPGIRQEVGYEASLGGNESLAVDPRGWARVPGLSSPQLEPHSSFHRRYPSPCRSSRRLRFRQPGHTQLKLHRPGENQASS